MSTGSHDLLARAVDDALEPLAAHHHCLFVTYLELLAEGRTPIDAVLALSRRSGEDEVYLCRILLEEVARRRAADPSGR